MIARRLFCPRIIASLGLCLLVGACASMHRANRDIAETPPGLTPVEWTWPALAPVRARTYTDPWQREVYTLYAGTGGARAELIYANATGTDTALQYPRYGLRKLTETWNINRGGLGRWGKVAHLQSGPRVFFYAPFRPAGTDRRCVAFGSDWALVPDDPQQRPGEALFGYFCPASAHPLDKLTIRKALTGIRIPETATQRAPAPPHPDPGPGATGNAHFPFSFARHYNVGNGPFL